MLENYLKIALRAMSKNKLYAAINIIGLAIGMAVYLFAHILMNYEQTHDTNFVNSDRIYTIGYRLTPDANIGVKELGTTHSTLGPLLEAEIDDIETTARTYHNSYVVTIGDKSFHEEIKFADPDFLTVFDFNYIQGQPNALEKPDALVITEEIAQKWFGRTDVRGETVMVNGDLAMQVTAVLEEVAINTHFNAMLIGNGLTVVASFAALQPLQNYDLNGNWNNLGMGDKTYVMTKVPLTDIQAFEQKVNDTYLRHASLEQVQGMIDSARVRKLPEVNTVLFDMTGMPIITSVKLLGLLILIIAIANYTNLASAQSMSRTREVGLRKTMGASRVQLMLQFMVESFTTVLLSMLLAVTAIELVLPGFNSVTNKVITLDYQDIAPLLLSTTVVTAILAGAYPSYLITRTTTLDALKDTNNKGQKGGVVRSVMIGAQFMLSIFMLAMVMIVFLQSQKVAESANIFPKEQVLVLERIGTRAIMEREEILRRELLAIKHIEAVAFSSIAPFDQSNSSSTMSKIKGDENGLVSLNELNITPDYMKVLDVPLITGRNLTLQDKRENQDMRVMNVILNELAVAKLGFSSVQEAIGESIWGATPQEEALDNFEYRIVGVVADRNYKGLHNQLKGFIHYIGSTPRRNGLVRISDAASVNVIQDIEAAWQRVFPDYPLEHRYLDDLFLEIFQIYQAMNGTLAGFALIAMILALIGLFGLAAFMARGRTKEIGVRKVMGASVAQIVRLLLWQFSKPVIWALAVALPMAMFATSLYLNFYIERISLQFPLIIIAGIVAILLAGSVIAVHAMRVAKASPISALRYE